MNICCDYMSIIQSCLIKAEHLAYFSVHRYVQVVLRVESTVAMLVLVSGEMGCC